MGASVDGAINSIRIDSNGDIVLGGDFTSVQGREIKGLVKVRENGNCQRNKTWYWLFQTWI